MELRVARGGPPGPPRTSRIEVQVFRTIHIKASSKSVLVSGSGRQKNLLVWGLVPISDNSIGCEGTGQLLPWARRPRLRPPGAGAYRLHRHGAGPRAG